MILKLFENLLRSRRRGGVRSYIVRNKKVNVECYNCDNYVYFIWECNEKIMK